jgi:uncharacterized damage-inducible protein DinB
MELLKQAGGGDSAGNVAHQLKAGCSHSLSQCEELLNNLSEIDYKAFTAQSSSIGEHVRHMLDRYESFFQGLPSRQLDYDARAREKPIEESLQAAKSALASVQGRLAALTAGHIQNQPLMVSETVHQQGAAVRVPSTAERELMSLVTHSIHHLAIIALLAKAMGYDLDQKVGKAPSTLVFEKA